jgi:hypothetical protein
MQRPQAYNAGGARTDGNHIGMDLDHATMTVIGLSSAANRGVADSVKLK